MLDYKKLLESLLSELIDEKIISEWYCNGVGYFWKYNEKDNRIEELEIENKKLKTDYEVLSCSVGDFGELQNKLEEEQRKNNGLSDQLTKAKEIIKNLMYTPRECISWYDLCSKAEQFIKEIEK